MLANYGYKDASGDFFITIDTDMCNGCGKCMEVCPSLIFKLEDKDPHDPMRDGPVAVVMEDKRKRLKYDCNPCKPSGERQPLPCVMVCEAGAIMHSW